MKFDCGESWEQRRERLTNWHRWFAWRPVLVGSHDCRWLEFVERKGTPPPLYPTFWTWEYRQRGNRG